MSQSASLFHGQMARQKRQKVKKQGRYQLDSQRLFKKFNDAIPKYNTCIKLTDIRRCINEIDKGLNEALRKLIALDKKFDSNAFDLKKIHDVAKDICPTKLESFKNIVDFGVLVSKICDRDSQTKILLILLLCIRVNISFSTIYTM
eukprot:NODE_187_length_15673_cov_0.222743.p7 type:complete len:146 gc:universal NODE_187_length_15673_cov_0.222743:3734-3297(-)